MVPAEEEEAGGTTGATERGAADTAGKFKKELTWARSSGEIPRLCMVWLLAATDSDPSWTTESSLAAETAEEGACMLLLLAESAVPCCWRRLCASRSWEVRRDEETTPPPPPPPSDRDGTSGSVTILPPPPVDAGVVGLGASVVGLGASLVVVVFTTLASFASRELAALVVPVAAVGVGVVMTTVEEEEGGGLEEGEVPLGTVVAVTIPRGMDAAGYINTYIHTETPNNEHHNTSALDLGIGHHHWYCSLVTNPLDIYIPPPIFLEDPLPKLIMTTNRRPFTKHK